MKGKLAKVRNKVCSLAFYFAIGFLTFGIVIFNILPVLWLWLINDKTLCKTIEDRSKEHLEGMGGVW